MTRNSQVTLSQVKRKASPSFFKEMKLSLLGISIFRINKVSILSIWRLSRTLTVSPSWCRNSQMLWWKQLSWGLSWERKTKSYNTSAAEHKFIQITNLIKWQLALPQIIAHIKVSQSSSGRWISTSRGDCLSQAFIVQLWQRCYYFGRTRRRRRRDLLGPRKKDQWKTVLWSDKPTLSFLVLGWNI